MGIFGTKKKPDHLRLYLNCDEIPIWNLSKLLNGENYKWLVYGYDGGEFDNNLDVDICNEILDAIRNEFFEKNNNPDALDIIILYSEIDYLSRRYDVVKAILDVLESGMYTEHCISGFISELKEWKYFGSFKDIDQEIVRLRSQHESSKITIGRKKEELNQLLKKNKGKKQSLIEQKVKLQRILSMQMDLKKMSATEWIETIKETERVIRAQEKNGKRDHRT